jgi:hypothetical protein
MDVSQIETVLKQNNSKNFVKRILLPEAYPTLKEAENQVATHKMAWGESDGKYYVFPTVMQEEDGNLKDYGKSAFDVAMKRREFIPFDNPKDAEDFSKNYKTYWDKIGYKPGGE